MARTKQTARKKSWIEPSVALARESIDEGPTQAQDEEELIFYPPPVPANYCPTSPNTSPPSSPVAQRRVQLSRACKFNGRYTK